MNQTLFLCGLHHVMGLGSATIAKLISFYRTPEEAWHHVTHRSVDPSLRCQYDLVDELQRPINKDLLDRIYESLEKHQIWVITEDSPLYPERLKQIYNKPLLLYGRGNKDCLSSIDRSMAMVGARKCTHYGEQVARYMSRSLSNAGVMIVSGGAMGIDKACHEGALQGRTSTIAVMGCGLDIAYPQSNKNLFTKIISEGGLLLSEYGPGIQARAYHFPLRNRIISGMTKGTIVVEAKASSGSLITADMAINEGRDVYAIPGNILNHACDGNHWLIKQGAIVLTDAEQILEEYGWQKDETYSNMEGSTKVSLSEEENIVFNRMKMTGPISIEELSAHTNLSLSSLHMVLLQLEIKKYICHVPQGYVICT